uniref:Retrotransposon Orf1 n=1 Tax=Tanacetum cinerariifolium TaxID=118510 RepID=A0A699HYP7_TANCI|nr:retrotransposon Orf1 [Tanacetum cinerariifolium]
MGDENPIHAFGDYSRPSHKGYRNTIEIFVGKNVVPLRSDTIRLMQNRCSFHGLRSEDPNQHLKDFRKLVYSLDLDVANRERTRLTAKLQNDILMFKQHQVNKIASSCEICGGPHDTQCCMENLEHAFVDYPSSRTDEVGGKWEDPEGIRGICNFTGRVKGMHIFVGNHTYVSEFMIIKDISSIIDPRLSQVVLGKPFVEISNMTHDLSLGVVRFTNRIDEIAYKMPHKIKQYNSLSDLEIEHTKSIYFRNKEDKIRGVDYAMSKILEFYQECLELRPEYLTRLEDE